MLRRFYQNHVFANLTYALVVALGVMAYTGMPREEYPDVNQNVMSVWITVQGLAAEDIEQRLTLPFEQLLRGRISDIRTVSSTIGAGYFETRLRFNTLDKSTFEKRGTELRREVQTAYATLFPKEAGVYWVWGDSGSVSRTIASVVLFGNGDPERFLYDIRAFRRDLERLPGVDKLDYFGYAESEIHIAFRPERLEGLGLNPLAVADSIKAYLGDEAAGPVALGDREWLVRVVGSGGLPGKLTDLPLVGAHGMVRLGDIADIVRGNDSLFPMPSSGERPAALFTVMKKNAADAFNVVCEINGLIAHYNADGAARGIEVQLVEDETRRTQTAIELMVSKAWWGLALVMLTSWLFLGARLAAVCTLAVPFALGGAFALLQAVGMTLNTSVLLGALIALGMLVDYAVIVVEAAAHRIRHGMDALNAALAGLGEVALPIICSLLTTVAAFLPLALLPGFLGGIMRVVPIAVTLALLAALIEALWMLPVHIVGLGALLARPSPLQGLRSRCLRKLHGFYGRALLACLRRPWQVVVPALLAFTLAGLALAQGWVAMDFFPKTPTRSFWIAPTFPAGTRADSTEPVFRRFAELIRAEVGSDELQTIVALPPSEMRVYLKPDGRPLPEILAKLDTPLRRVFGPTELSIAGQSSGGPQGDPITVKLTGPDFAVLKAAATDLQAVMAQQSAFGNLHSDYQGGAPQLDLALNGDAIQRSGIAPETVVRAIKLWVRGEVVSGYREGSDLIGVRVLAKPAPYQDLNTLLRQTVARPGGGAVPLAELVHAERKDGPQLIHHYNYRRVITLQANLDPSRLNLEQANAWIAGQWHGLQVAYPAVELDLTGEIEEVRDSLGGLKQFGLLGVGLIFLILGAQYRNYRQPLLILLKIPMGFAGVVLGLLVSGQTASLYTLYGGVALAGITVNAAILLFSAANDRVAAGMHPNHATFHAARRRLVPILITSFATIAGLLPLAVASAESASLWKPVATAIVWGLGFATLLNLFLVPLLYRWGMAWGRSTTI